MKKKGFTLVELLVVIAIIGILSSVVFASLSSARGKARIAAAQASLRDVNNVATMCDDAGGTLLPAGATVPTAAGSVCSTASAPGTWPSLPAGWAYTAKPADTASDSVWSFTATGDSATVTCTQNGCVKS